MTLENIKEQIESNSIKNTFIIFKCNDRFIARQYYKAISQQLNKKIDYIEDLTSIGNKSMDIFFQDTSENKNLRVCSLDTFDYYTNDLLNEEYLIIVCTKIEKNTNEIYKDFIVEVNPLEYWCVKDYLYSILKGMDTPYIDWLIDNCNCNINRLQLEADKLLLFDENERNIVFNQMLEDDAFSDISNKTIFNFTDAIVKKDINKLRTIYEEIDNIDIEDIGLVTVLYQNFKKLLQVWTTTNPTPESTGLSGKQIYAIKKLPKVWSEQQLVDILELLTSIDFKIKTGNMPMNILRDYLVVNILLR